MKKIIIPFSSDIKSNDMSTEEITEFLRKICLSLEDVVKYLKEIDTLFYKG